MAIKTSTFAGWRLSGKEADAFLKQVKNATPNPKATAAIVKGRPLAEEFLAKGQVVLGVKMKPSLKKS